MCIRDRYISEYPGSFSVSLPIYLLDYLSAKLTDEFGKGFDKSNIQMCIRDREGAVPLPEQEPVFTVYDDIRQKLIARGCLLTRLLLSMKPIPRCGKRSCSPKSVPVRCVDVYKRQPAA